MKLYKEIGTINNKTCFDMAELIEPAQLDSNLHQLASFGILDGKYLLKRGTVREQHHFEAKVSLSRTSLLGGRKGCLLANPMVLFTCPDFESSRRHQEALGRRDPRGRGARP